MRIHIGNRHGFTLIELMISLAIIIMVTAIAIPNFQKAGEKAQISACSGNQKVILAQVDNYYLSEKSFPVTTIAGLGQFYPGFDMNQRITESSTDYYHKAYHDLQTEQSMWHPIDMQEMKDKGYLKEIVTCPKDGIYLIKIESGQISQIMCSVHGDLNGN
ncbi:hypothetical protein BHU72_02115 [Desulfuribacillus stibiiarsenatis]|uniref:Prepilin-type N-terminal cleavage/methylation domain-containing protein n=1 Tax=Desulfuribacillus stibiiarsenatis TaxID=1390249 RepID=A0A1E5L642_9FIRM|nr:type II secretion system protein [Desulfuribacillus stibiiarsenatis]OEH85617.1 hypothetical protein BHU72_02115 [Desulfuribacillus stibiiarsenatis]